MGADGGQTSHLLLGGQSRIKQSHLLCSCIIITAPCAGGQPQGCFEALVRPYDTGKRQRGKKPAGLFVSLVFDFAQEKRRVKALVGTDTKRIRRAHESPSLSFSPQQQEDAEADFWVAVEVECSFSPPNRGTSRRSHPRCAAG